MILISPYSRKLPGMTGPNPKDYPWWPEVISELKTKAYEVWQVGVGSEVKLVADKFIWGVPLKILKEFVLQCEAWASVDNFFHHFCAYFHKPGVVVWGPSDPVIFGHPENVNLLKGQEYLRPLQFDSWGNIEFSKERFVSPEMVVEEICKLSLRSVEQL